jgi:hypothetical protein
MSKVAEFLGQLQCSACGGKFVGSNLQLHPFERPIKGPTCPLCKAEAQFRYVEIPRNGLSPTFIGMMVVVLIAFIAWMSRFS